MQCYTTLYSTKRFKCIMLYPAVLHYLSIVYTPLCKHGYLAREDPQSNLPSATNSEALLAPGVGYLGAVELESLSFGHSLLRFRAWGFGGLWVRAWGFGGFGAGIRAESLGHFGDFDSTPDGMNPHSSLIAMKLQDSPKPSSDYWAQLALSPRDPKEVGRLCSLGTTWQRSQRQRNSRLRPRLGGFAVLLFYGIRRPFGVAGVVL